jgi:glucose-6-phosphate 1-dehydrogenase
MHSPNTENSSLPETRAAVAKATAPDSKAFAPERVVEGTLDPCMIVIAGASGDLAARKLIPALFRLKMAGGLPECFLIVGCSRTEWSSEQFREKMREAVSPAPEQKPDWESFSANLHYRAIDYSSPASFSGLRDFLQGLDPDGCTFGNRVFYLAIPPGLYETVALRIGEAGLVSEDGSGGGWSRIIVEKPFGSDLETAVALDRSLHAHFREHQIFRIDHYLAKETVQNVLMFRFANSIFEPVWDRRYIEYVSIAVAESLGVEQRAGYYETAGVLRDMFQNHMMQLLCLIAMEPPSLFEAERIRDEKAKVFRALRPFVPGRLREDLVLGQYGPGEIDGQRVRGYREEPGVAPESLTPTFASLRAFIDNWRWQGVPFYLTSGKRLARKVTEIVIQFKEIPHSLFRSGLSGPISANRITLGVYPEEKISLVFQAKSPGATVRLRPVAMDFSFLQGYRGPILDAYEKVLIDCIRGDQTLFWREDGVELCWSYLTPILEVCEACGDRAGMLAPYEAGTWGPPSFLKTGADIS